MALSLYHQRRHWLIPILGLSLFAVVLYIRVRFAEYSYGYAAVAALTLRSGTVPRGWGTPTRSRFISSV